MAKQSSVHVVKVDGLKETVKALKKAGGPDTAKALRLAAKEAVEVVAEEARFLVPVRSGALKKTIAAIPANTSGVVRAGSAKAVQYAGPIHFGWAKRNIKPQPFIYEALDKRIDEVLAAYEVQMDKVVDGVNKGSYGAPGTTKPKKPRKARAKPSHRYEDADGNDI